MYCPKCSRQQVSEDVRYCSRCGLQLDAVRGLLGEDAGTPAAGEAEPRLTPARKRDILLGATVMLVGSVAVALIMISTAAGTPLQAVIIPLLILWLGLAAALLLSGHAAREVSKLFSKEAPAPLRESLRAQSRGSAPPPGLCRPPRARPCRGRARGAPARRSWRGRRA